MSELINFELLDIMVSLHARNAFTSLATEHYLNTQYYGRSEDEITSIFKTNVANTILYQSNSALIKQSVIAIVDYIDKEIKMGTLSSSDFDDYWELKNHRDVISHPAIYKFSNQKVQQFYAAGLHYKDPKVLRIWRIRNKIIDKLKELNSKRSFDIEITVQLGTVELIYGALNASLKESELPFSFDIVKSSVHAYFIDYERTIRKSVLEETKVELS